MLVVEVYGLNTSISPISPERSIARKKAGSLTMTRQIFTQNGRQRKMFVNVAGEP